jgi:hypothetical protein
LPPAWHRNEERRARGLWPVHNPATQLEGWERELVWMEILLMTGIPEASFRHLARGWGRDKGFHMVLAQFICGRQGDVERKKRERANGVGKGRRPKQAQNDGDYIGADVWGDGAGAVYGNAHYYESLAADLIVFDDETSPASGQHTHARKSSFTFHEEGEDEFGEEFDVSSSADA